MKIVMRSCFKRKYENPTDSDETLVHRSLVDVIQPILRPTDVPIFHEIIKDLFPSIERASPVNVSLRQAFDDVCSSEELQPIDRLYEKLVETHATMAERHALMLIGDPYTGKSTILRILAKALSASNGDAEMEIGELKLKWSFECLSLMQGIL